MGRAARVVGSRRRGGRLVLQTRSPEHEVLDWARTADPQAVMDAETARRRILGFPPFGAVAELSGDAAAVEAAIAGLDPAVRVLGPTSKGTGLTALLLGAGPEMLAETLTASAGAGRAVGRLRVAVDPPRV